MKMPEHTMNRLSSRHSPRKRFICKSVEGESFRSLSSANMSMARMSSVESARMRCSPCSRNASRAPSSSPSARLRKKRSKGEVPARERRCAAASSCLASSTSSACHSAASSPAGAKQPRPAAESSSPASFTSISGRQCLPKSSRRNAPVSVLFSQSVFCCRMILLLYRQALRTDAGPLIVTVFFTHSNKTFCVF